MISGISAGLMNASAVLLSLVCAAMSGVCDELSGIATFSGIADKIGYLGASPFYDAIMSACRLTIKETRAVGYALCMLFFIISLVELGTSDRMTLEYFIKFLSKFAIGIAVIWKSADLFQSCIEFGDALAEFFEKSEALSILTTEFSDMGSIFTSMLTSLSEPMQMLGRESGIGVALVVFFISMITLPFFLLASGYALVSGFMTCISRIMEMLVRGIFLPIACAMLTDDGWRGAGGRYIRKFLASCAQAAVIVLILMLTNTIVSSVIKSLLYTDSFLTAIADGTVMVIIRVMVLDMAFKLAFGMACLLGGTQLMQRSIGLTNDIFGA